MEQQHQPVTQTKYGIVAPTRNPNQTELLGMEQHLPVSQTKPNNYIQHVNLYLGSGSRGRDTSWSSMWRNEATWCAGLNYVKSSRTKCSWHQVPFYTVLKVAELLEEYFGWLTLANIKVPSM